MSEANSSHRSATPAPSPWAPEVHRDAGEFTLLLAALLLTQNKPQPRTSHSPGPGRAAPARREQPALPPGACSGHWETSQPSSFQAALSQDPKNKSSPVPAPVLFDLPALTLR